MTWLVVFQEAIMNFYLNKGFLNLNIKQAQGQKKWSIYCTKIFAYVST